MTIPAVLILATLAVWSLAAFAAAPFVGRATARHQRSP